MSASGVRFGAGAVAVQAGEVYEADTPRGVRRVRVVGVDAQTAQIEVLCGHLLCETIGRQGECAHGRIESRLSWRDGAWRMSGYYRAAR